MCVCVCVCVCVCALSPVWLLATPWTLACLPWQNVGPSPWNFPGRYAGVDCHFLLQGIFPTQGSNSGLLHLLHWQADSLSLCHMRGLPHGKSLVIENGCSKVRNNYNTEFHHHFLCVFAYFMLSTKPTIWLVILHFTFTGQRASCTGLEQPSWATWWVHRSASFCHTPTWVSYMPFSPHWLQSQRLKLSHKLAGGRRQRRK